MNTAADTSSDVATPPPPDFTVEQGAGVAWRVQMLDRLIGIGMEMAQRAQYQMRHANWLGVEGPAMYDLITRAVRRTAALATRLEEEMKAPPKPPSSAGLPRERSQESRDRASDRADDHDGTESEAEAEREQLFDRNDEMTNRPETAVTLAVHADLREAVDWMTEKFAKPEPAPEPEPPPKSAPPPIDDGMPVKGRGSFILSNPNIDVQIGRDTAGLPEDYWSRTRGPPPR